MQLLDALRRLGDRLGIIELSPESSEASRPVKVQTRTITLSELLTTIQVVQVRELAEFPVELSAPFADVYEAAGIREPAGGWTVERLEQFLQADRIRSMDRAHAQEETARALAAENVDAADVIKDAVARDQALDAFEESIAGKRDLWLAAKRQLLSALAAQVHALQEQQKKIQAEIATEEEAWKGWRRRKRQCEKDMAHAVSYLIDRPVVSITDE